MRPQIAYFPMGAKIELAYFEARGMPVKQKREAEDTGCLVLVKYEDGYWPHDLANKLSYLDGEDFIRLIDS